MMEEFIPCPFCNKPMSEDNFFSCDGYPQACGCWEKTHSCEEALKVWNSRPREEALQKRIDELEESARIDEIINKLKAGITQRLREENNQLKADLEFVQHVVKQKQEFINGFVDQQR